MVMGLVQLLACSSLFAVSCLHVWASSSLSHTLSLSLFPFKMPIKQIENVTFRWIVLNNQRFAGDMNADGLAGQWKYAIGVRTSMVRTNSHWAFLFLSEINNESIEFNYGSHINLIKIKVWANISIWIDNNRRFGRNVGHSCPISETFEDDRLMNDSSKSVALRDAFRLLGGWVLDKPPNV